MNVMKHPFLAGCSSSLVLVHTHPEFYQVSRLAKTYLTSGSGTVVLVEVRETWRSEVEPSKTQPESKGETKQTTFSILIIDRKD